MYGNPIYFYMNINFYSFLFLYLFFSFSVSAQESFGPGKVYTLKGDTLNGFINSQMTARYLKYRSAAGEVKEFTPIQVNGFNFEGNLYKSKEVEADLPIGKIKEPLFMQQLIEGRANLYYYKEKDNSEHYWVEKGTEIKELRVVDKTIHDKDGRIYLRKEKEFLRILNYLFNDCSKYKISEIPFSRLSLIKEVVKYNECFEGENSIVLAKKERMKIHPGIKIGGSQFLTLEAQGKFTPSAGVFVNLPLNKASRLLSIQFEANYNNYLAVVLTTEYRFGYRSLDVGALMRAMYPKGYIKPFLGLGFMYGMGKRYVIPAASSQKIGHSQFVFPKTLVEGGFQVPLRRRYVYTAARYERVMHSKGMKYRMLNFSLGLGF